MMMSIVLATLMLVSLFAVVTSPASASVQASGTTAPFVGGTLAGTGPAVSSSNAGENLFAVDTGGTSWSTSIGGCSTWSSIGGVSTASPAAISWSSSYPRIDAFVRGTDRAVWHKYWGGSSLVPGEQQGLAWDGSYYYYITTTEIFKLDSNMNIITSNLNAAAQCGGDHMGDGAVYNGKLYAVCVNSTGGGQWIGVWNTRDLSFVQAIDLSTAQSASAVTVNPDGNLIVDMGLITPPSSGSSLYTYNLTTHAYVGTITPSSPLWYTEGMDYYNGHYYASYLANYDSNGTPDATGGVAMMNSDGSGMQRIIPYSAFTYGGKIEGIDVKSDYIRVQCGGYVYLFTTASPHTLAKVMTGVDAINTNWSNWESLGGQLASGTGPAVASWNAGRLDVFVQGTDGALWSKAWTGSSWSGWISLGGKLTSSPAATSPGNGVIDVFVRGSDGSVWQKIFHNGWSSWKSLGGQLPSGTGPAVSQDLWLFVQGTDHQLWQKAAGSSGASWAKVGAPSEALSVSSPAAVLSASGHGLVCVISTSGNVWYSVRNATGLFNYWYSAGSPP